MLAEQATVPTAGSATSESIRLLRALRHLNQLLPLKYRQAALPAELRAVHRGILYSFAERGRPLTRAELERFGNRERLHVLRVVALPLPGGFLITEENEVHSEAVCRGG